MHVHCRLFDINPKGSVPIIHDLEKDTWVPGAHCMFPMHVCESTSSNVSVTVISA